MRRIKDVYKMLPGRLLDKVDTSDLPIFPKLSGQKLKHTKQMSQCPGIIHTLGKDSSLYRDDLNISQKPSQEAI